jgi:hypothetical protein
MEACQELILASQFKILIFNPEYWRFKEIKPMHGVQPEPIL